MTSKFEFSGGGKQGGVETPDQWRAMFEHLCEPMISHWNELGSGFTLDDGSGQPPTAINHAIWVDTSELAAKKYTMVQFMIDQLTAACSRFRNSDGQQRLR